MREPVRLPTMIMLNSGTSWRNTRRKYLDLYASTIGSFHKSGRIWWPNITGPSRNNRANLSLGLSQLAGSRTGNGRIMKGNFWIWTKPIDSLVLMSKCGDGSAQLSRRSTIISTWGWLRINSLVSVVPTTTKRQIVKDNQLGVGQELEPPVLQVWSIKSIKWSTKWKIGRKAIWVMMKRISSWVETVKMKNSAKTNGNALSTWKPQDRQFFLCRSMKICWWHLEQSLSAFMIKKVHN